MKSVEGLARKVGIGLASAMVLLSFVGVLAVPAFAGGDPSYFIDCSTAATAGPGTWNLVEGVSPSTQTTCPNGSLTASGTAVTAFTDGSVSNGVVYIDSTTAISGTYTMVDCGTSSTCSGSTVTIASGTFSGAGKVNSCSGQNSLTFTGSGNNGAVINTGDILELTLTISSSSVAFCSGGAGTVLTPTAVNVEAAVPEFGAAIAAVALAFLALRVVRKKGTTSLGPMPASV